MNNRTINLLVISVIVLGLVAYVVKKLMEQERQARMGLELQVNETCARLSLQVERTAAVAVRAEALAVRALRTPQAALS